MATVLPDLMDHLVTLLEGTASGIDRSIDSGRFEHVPFSPLWALPNTVSAPYPFEILDDGEHFPNTDPAQTTMAPDQQWAQCDLRVRVGYAASPNDSYARLKTIQQDRYSIRVCLEDPDSWYSATGFQDIDLGTLAISYEIIEGSDESDAEVMLILEVPLTLTYREDTTS